ncbi:hypothetical protein EV379_2822 [Microterricola gilva]|uniref:AbiEi antitoxin N-terminal domain-containing protein n=2 Tax=Microterricola gilva TaxID=393267 RepID=A0A4Q8AP94_9MICO|nr:hypothetical protein EV379_2822 [Microterricola gilva]
MIDTLELLSALDGGLISVVMLRDAGVSSRWLERLVATGVLTRVRRGAFVLTSVWRTMWPNERYRLFVRATVASSPRALVVSHLSAAVMHGLPLVGEWPQTLHVLDAGAGGGASSRLMTSHRSVPESDTVLIDGVRVTALARTLADIAIAETLERSVPALDAGLHSARVAANTVARLRGVPWGSEEMAALAQLAEHGLREQLSEELELLAPRRWRLRAERAIGFANGLADGAGESLSRVRFVELGFEIPELQVRFDGADGRDAFVDCFWRGVRKGGEFDGNHKYMRGVILKPGQDPGEIVFAEKRREDALRTQLNSMARWVWDEVLPARTFFRFLTEHDVPRAQVRAQMPRRTPSRPSVPASAISLRPATPLQPVPESGPAKAAGAR